MSARRPWAWPLVPAYGAALAAKDALRAAGMKREKSLRWPVLSVGSVSAGGAGKTPVVIALAKLLSSRGWCVDVLSRGYCRRGKGVEQVEPEAGDAAHRFGDEPVEIARATRVPVWVGASRFAAGTAAESMARLSEGAYGLPRGHAKEDEEGAPAYAHLLDDGMQHRELARQFELVLVTLEDLEDTLVPAGNLREPLSALRRADALAIREDELEVVGPRVRALCRPDVPLWTVRRTLRFPSPLGVFSAGLRPLAFCGLARPQGFASMLADAGCGVVDTVVFRDHHRYDDGDIALLVKMARGMQASGLVTTEKDAVKLSRGMRERLEAEVGPLTVVQLQASFVYESPVVRALENKLRAAREQGERVEARVR